MYPLCSLSCCAVCGVAKVYWYIAALMVSYMSILKVTCIQEVQVSAGMILPLVFVVVGIKR